MILLLGSIVISSILAFISIKIAPKIGLMDIPGSAAHKKHEDPIPLTGGLILIDTMIIMMLATGLWKDSEIGPILLSSLIIGLFGLIDDYFNLSPLKKLSGQLCAATLLISMGVQVSIFDSPEFIYRTGSELDFWLNIVITFLWCLPKNRSKLPN